MQTIQSKISVGTGAAVLATVAVLAGFAAFSAYQAQVILRAGEGKTKVDEVAEAVTAITQESEKAMQLVDEVSQGSQEQARGLEQISTAIAQMEQVTQRVAAGAEECASASEEMTAQAAGVNDIVGRLEELVGVRSNQVQRKAGRS